MDETLPLRYLNLKQELQVAIFESLFSRCFLTLNASILSPSHHLPLSQRSS